jgi:hypothetical protein
VLRLPLTLFTNVCSRMLTYVDGCYRVGAQATTQALYYSFYYRNII